MLYLVLIARATMLLLATIFTLSHTTVLPMV